ncbi:MAG TPA: hypothetical protein VF600_03540 [Abditibacteriaceae bacterium]|jgi:hypothetical protein
MPENESLGRPVASASAEFVSMESPTWDENEQQDALRWRRAILKLSETLLSAADEHRDLSPFLMEAMHYALENLLVYGDERDLMALEEWLTEESPADTGAQTGEETRQ